MSEISQPATAEQFTPFTPTPGAPPAGEPSIPAPKAEANEPPPPTGHQWNDCRLFLQHLSGIGVKTADEQVVRMRGIEYYEMRSFFGAINPDPTLDGKDHAAAQRAAMGLEGPIPNSLADALTEIMALEGGHKSAKLKQLVEYTKKSLQFCEPCDQPKFPPWANRSLILQGQRAFMTRLLPATLVLLCKSLPEAYCAPRPSSVLNLSRQLTKLPYHRLLGTLQLLVTVATPHSFEGPWFPALLAAEEMQLLHAGVRMNVAPRMEEEVHGQVERTLDGWQGRDDYLLWGGYTAFRNGWPHSDDKPDSPAAPPQVVVNQADMLATIIAFSLTVVDGLRQLDIEFNPGDDEAYWHMWRVFAVFKGIHPPDDPMSDAWIPKTLGEARLFWQTYKREYYAGPKGWTDPDWQEQAKQANPAGYALASSHIVMIANFLDAMLPLPMSKEWYLKAARWFVVRLLKKDAARIGVAPVRMSRLEQWFLETGPRKLTKWAEGKDVGMQVAVGRWALTWLIRRVYGSRVIFPVPQTVDDLKQFVTDTKLKGKLADQDAQPTEEQLDQAAMP